MTDVILKRRCPECGRVTDWGENPEGDGIDKYTGKTDLICLECNFSTEAVDVTAELARQQSKPVPEEKIGLRPPKPPIEKIRPKAKTKAVPISHHKFGKKVGPKSNSSSRTR